MEAIKSRLTIEKTTYVRANQNYTIENVTIAAEYLDSKQKI